MNISQKEKSFPVDIFFKYPRNIFIDTVYYKIKNLFKFFFFRIIIILTKSSLLNI